ncbi:FtsX-like permease family protein [Spirosoma gilvum]
MRDWHLFSTYENGAVVTSPALRYVWVYGLIGLFVLGLTSINYVNLATARSQKRSREVGIRKAIGSMRRQLMNQFFTESLLTVTIALVLALVDVELALPWFNYVADKHLALLWRYPVFWALIGAFLLVTSLLSGIYPTLFPSSFQPIRVLKGNWLAGRGEAAPRKVLVVIQFSVSTILLIGTLVVYRQIQFAKDRPVGYSRQNLLEFRKSTSEFDGKSELIMAELLKTGLVIQVAESSSRVTDIGAMNGGFSWCGKDPALNPSFGTVRVSADYGKTIGWQFVAGRDFSSTLATDSAGLVLNEATVDEMGLTNQSGESPVGELIRWKSDFNEVGTFKILGVVKNMVMKSPFEPIKPTIFYLQGYQGFLFAKLKPHCQCSQPQYRSIVDAVVDFAFLNNRPNYRYLNLTSSQVGGYYKIGTHPTDRPTKLRQ